MTSSSKFTAGSVRAMKNQSGWLRPHAHAANDAGDVARVIESPVVRTLEGQAERAQGAGDTELLPLAEGGRELCLQVQMPRAEGVADLVIRAVLQELVAVVIPPRAEERILERVHP